MVSFAVWKLQYDVVLLVYFAFVTCALVLTSKIALPRPMLRSVYPVFAARGSIVSGFTFKSLIHFK